MAMDHQFSSIARMSGSENNEEDLLKQVLRDFIPYLTNDQREQACACCTLDELGQSTETLIWEELDNLRKNPRK